LGVRIVGDVDQLDLGADAEFGQKVLDVREELIVVGAAVEVEEFDQRLLARIVVRLNA
jgi:hypothetical protein